MSRFLQALKDRANQGFVPVIPDIKRISPKEGPLFVQRDPVDAAVMLAKAGAPVLSVVTEETHFGGSLKLLRDIAEVTGLPVLRKDFIQSTKDIEETAALGAAAVLLICASMEEGLLRKCYAAALDLGLEPLVEAHTQEELRLAADLHSRLFGINNRDILNLEKDSGTVGRTSELAKLKPSGSFLVSESGILNDR